MSKRCFIVGCESREQHGFSFPTSDLATKIRWLEAVGQYQRLPANYESGFICGAHFSNKDFLKDHRKEGELQLSKEAIPSIFPQSTSTSIRTAIDNPVVVKEEIEDIEDFVGGQQNMQFAEVEDDLEEVEMTDDDRFYEYLENSDYSNDYNSDSREGNETTRHKEYNDEAPSKHTFEAIDLDDEIDSDYEPVTDYNLKILQYKLKEKDELLQKDQSKLGSIKEIIANQQKTITRLEAELKQVTFNENCNIKSEIIDTSVASEQSQNVESSERNLKTFAIALYYFSPKVYAYLRSMIPFLPPKSAVNDWVTSGHAASILPSKLLVHDKFCLE